MWKFVMFLWKFIGWMQRLIGPALVILAAVVGYLLVEKLIFGGFIKL